MGADEVGETVGDGGILGAERLWHGGIVFGGGRRFKLDVTPGLRQGRLSASRRGLATGPCHADGESG